MFIEVLQKQTTWLSNNRISILWYSVVGTTGYKIIAGYGQDEVATQPMNDVYGCFCMFKNNCYCYFKSL